jgi:hypothetical protein
MNIKASVREQCKCCLEEFIYVPLDDGNLCFAEDGETCELQVSMDEANSLIKKLQKLTKV